MATRTKTYRYRWQGGHAAHLGYPHTTPEGEGVALVPGEEFETVEPVEQLDALPLSAEAKAAREKSDKERAAAEAEAEALLAEVEAPGPEEVAAKEESAKTEAPAGATSKEQAP